MNSLQQLYAWASGFQATTDANFKELLSKSREENSQLRTELDLARASLSSNIESLGKAVAEAAKLKIDLEASTKELTELKAKAQTVDQLASIKAASITAAQGQPPIPLSPETNPATPKQDPFAGLQGMEKAAAQLRAQKKG